MDACQRMPYPKPPDNSVSDDASELPRDRKRKSKWPQTHCEYLQDHDDDVPWWESPLPTAETFDRYPGLRNLSCRQFDILKFRVKVSYLVARNELGGGEVGAGGWGRGRELFSAVGL